MSILNKNVSYYPCVRDTTKGLEVNLLKILRSNRHLESIAYLRKTIDPFQQKAQKENLPCYTIAGTFSTRSNAGLLIPSGLAAVDLDSAEDYDCIVLLKELKKIPYIAYCGLSCRGQRLFAIVPFATSNYKAHYTRLIQSFEDIGLPMGDDCHKKISQPRFVSSNTPDSCFYNHKAKLYDLFPAPAKLIKKTSFGFQTGKGKINPLETAIKMVHEAPDGQKWRSLTKASYLLGGYISTGTITENEARQILQIAISSKIGVNNFQAAFKTIEKGLKSGQLKPIYSDITRKE